MKYLFKTLALLFAMVLTGIMNSCQNEDSDDSIYRFSEASACSGGLVFSGDLSYTIYGSQEDFIKETNPAMQMSGLPGNKVDLQGLEDGKNYWVYIEKDGYTNWQIGLWEEGNFQYQSGGKLRGFLGQNAILYTAEQNLIGSYALSSLVINSIERINDANFSCRLDDYLELTKGFELKLFTGSATCGENDINEIFTWEHVYICPSSDITVVSGQEIFTTFVLPERNESIKFSLDNKFILTYNDGGIRTVATYSKE